jgi:predicted secreted protein
MTDIIQEWPTLAKQAILEATTDEELVDIAGDLNSTVNLLQSLKRSVASEIPSDTRGSRWRYFIPGMKAKRTYNDSSLLRKFMEHWDADGFATVNQLLFHGIVKVEWQYSKLDAFTKKHGIELVRTTAREVHDGDEYDIGEIWSPQYPRYEAVTDGD